MLFIFLIPFKHVLVWIIFCTNPIPRLNTANKCVNNKHYKYHIVFMCQKASQWYGDCRLKLCNAAQDKGLVNIPSVRLSVASTDISQPRASHL